MTLTKQQADALRKVVEAKLRLWDAANEAERLLQVDVDSNGGGLNDLCASLVQPEDARHLDDQYLIEAFELTTSEEEIKRSRTNPETGNTVGTNSGHGHVWERSDGHKARCGGPTLFCKECRSDKAWADSLQQGTGSA